MPKISQIDAPDNLGLRPTEVGITATAAAARRIGSEYSEIAAAKTATGRNVTELVQSVGTMALKFAEHMELSTGMAQAAKVSEGLDKSRDERISKLDPNDPAYAQKVEGITAEWREKTLEPALEQFSRGFITTKGQKWAQDYVASTRETMFRKSTTDVSSAAGIGFKNNVKTMVSAASNEALRNPGETDRILGELDKNVTTLVSTSGMKGLQAAKVQTELVDDARRKVIELGASGAVRSATDPEAVANDWITRYPKYIDGEKALSLAKAATAQQKSNQLAVKQAQLLDKQVGEQAAHGAANKLMTDYVKVDPANPGRVLIDPKYFQTALDIAKMPHAPDGLARTLINWGEQQQKEKKEVHQSDAVIRQDLLTRMDINDNRTTEIQILRAEAEGKLERADAAQLLRLQKATNERPEGEPLKQNRQLMVNTFKFAIDPTMGGDPLSAGKYYRFQTDMRAREQQLIEEGKSPMEVYNPNSPHWFGRPENLLRYKVSDQERTQYEAAEKAAAKAAKAPAAAPPLQPPTPPKITIDPKAPRGSKQNPIVIPQGTTVEQASQLKLNDGDHFIGPDGRLRTWGKAKQ